MRLEDFAIIIVALIGCALALFGGMALIAFWPRPWSDIAAFVGAIWRRYVGSWPAMMERIADDGVNGYQTGDGDRGDDIMSPYRDLAVLDDRAPTRTRAGTPAGEITSEKAETSRRNGELPGEAFSFAEMESMFADRLAEMVLDGLLNKTDAIKKGLQGKSGDAYQKKKAILDAALSRVEASRKPTYPDLDEESRPAMLGRTRARRV